MASNSEEEEEVAAMALDEMIYVLFNEEKVDEMALDKMIYALFNEEECADSELSKKECDEDEVEEVVSALEWQSSASICKELSNSHVNFLKNDSLKAAFSEKLEKRRLDGRKRKVSTSIPSSASFPSDLHSASSLEESLILEDENPQKRHRMELVIVQSSHSKLCLSDYEVLLLIND